MIYSGEADRGISSLKDESGRITPIFERQLIRASFLKRSSRVGSSRSAGEDFDGQQLLLLPNGGVIKHICQGKASDEVFEE